MNIEGLLGDASLVGTTFLEDLFESKDNINESISQMNFGEGLIATNQISRIIPIQENSNDLEESSGLLKQLESGTFCESGDTQVLNQKDIQAFKTINNSDKKSKRVNLKNKKFKKSSKLNIEDILLDYKIEDFFQPNIDENILHFFEPKSKNFYYADLDKIDIMATQAMQDNISQNSSILFEKLELFCDEEINRHHKSVSTPDGSIVLTGGLKETIDGIL